MVASYMDKSRSSYRYSYSVNNTINNRIGLAKHSIYEIRAIVEDTRATRLGGINVALDIFNAAIVPRILHNGETWYNIPKKDF